MSGVHSLRKQCCRHLQNVRYCSENGTKADRTTRNRPRGPEVVCWSWSILPFSLYFCNFLKDSLSPCQDNDQIKVADLLTSLNDAHIATGLEKMSYLNIFIEIVVSYFSLLNRRSPWIILLFKKEKERILN